MARCKRCQQSTNDQLLFITRTVKLRYNVFLGTIKNSTLYQRYVGPALVAEWVKPPAAVHAGQGSLPAWVEA